MFWQYRRIPRWLLLSLALFGLILAGLIELTEKEIKRSHFDKKLEAAEKMQEATEAIKNYRAGTDIFIDYLSDPSGTGLIGQEFSLITTDQGDLDEKLTSVNPNFAALALQYLEQAGVEEDDFVAIGWTGSFPGMNIAFLSALDIIGANAVIITSLGSSMWGANNPDLTWLHMEQILNKKGIFDYRSIAASIGGRGDRGGNISPKGRETIRSIIYNQAIDIIEEQTLSRSINRRMELYQRNLPDDEEFSAYINVGGGLGSIGSSHNLVLIPNGLVKSIPLQNYPRRGTLILFGEEGIPVINIIDINKIAQKNGLPISPEPLPEPPSGGVFYRLKYNLYAVAGALVVYLTVLIIFISRKKKG
ncbi:MAG: poly-gamma-glutamate system protein [Candidatus Zixiibacteriota bacterium]